MSSNNPLLTLDQIQVLDVIATEGSVAKASKALRKAHSALLYSLAHLESQLGAPLVDRSGYRLTLTPFGKKFLTRGRELLNLEQELRSMANTFNVGWESELEIVYDGLLEVKPILKAAHEIRKTSDQTSVSLTSEYLSGVHARFENQSVAAMVTVLPYNKKQIPFIKLPAMRSWLVAHRDHDLSKGHISSLELERYPFLTVRGSDERLEMSTTSIKRSSTIHVGDFFSKRLAILEGYGYGWLPEYLVKNDLKKKTLRPIKWDQESTHVFEPRLYIKKEFLDGKAINLFTQLYKNELNQ